jgi:outer membrane protein TolC
VTRRHLVPALAVLLTTVSAAQAESLHLREAMATARERAQQVLAAEARVTAGQARFSQAKGYRAPQVSFQEMWIRTNNPAEVFAFQLNQGRFSFNDFVVSDPNDPDYLNNATSRFLLTMPLYTGGELAGRIDQARLAAQAAEIEATWISNSAALAAAEAYIRLSQARENVRLLEQVVATVDTHVRLAQAYVDQGMLVRSELLRAQVERSRIEDLLIEARGQARVARSNLAFRMGVDAGREWELQPLEDPQALAEELDAWLSTAENRADLTAARHMLQAAELEIKVQRSGLMPKIGMAARYDMFSDQLFTSDNDSAAIMAMLSVDLFSGNRHRSAKAAAEADFLAGQQQISQFTEGVRLEVRDAYERAITARERFLTAQAAQEAAIEAERITEQRFKQGVVKMIDLVDATTARQEAQTRELVARAEAHLASLALAAKAGRRPEEMLNNHLDTAPRNES